MARPVAVRAGADPFKAFAAILGLSHLAFCAFTTGVRVEHLAADLLVVSLPWAGRRASGFLRAALPMWMGGVIEDNQRVLLPLRGVIHTGDLARLDARLFPAPGGTSWPFWFGEHTNRVLDFASGAAYLLYLPELLLAALLLYLADPRRLTPLAFAFLFVSAAGVAIYIAVPAAPPWYVQTHGPGPADLAASPSPAGAARFDQMLGITWFSSFYSRNPNLFGAMPSLHAAYPVLVLWQVRRRLRWAATAYAALVAFAAVYLGHHWVIDVVAGWALAIASCLAGDAVARLRQGVRSRAGAVLRPLDNRRRPAQSGRATGRVAPDTNKGATRGPVCGGPDAPAASSSSCAGARDGGRGLRRS